MLRSRRVGLMTNHTGKAQNGATTIQVLRELGVSVEALFAPEHGSQGTREGDIESSRDNDGTPIHSLYGETRRPTDVMLANLDTLVFDIQDVGARFYTYSATMAGCMEECAARGLSFVVLDRPNPLGGDCVDGPLVAEEVRSFVGYLRVPVRHGMTLGELALWHRADAKFDLDLHIVPVANWRRSMQWSDSALPWIAPSPNLPDFESARWYPAICLLEFSGISVGRGTQWPFQIVGAPWLDAARIEDTAQSWPDAIRRDVVIEATNFKPEHSVFAGESCRGVRLSARDETVKDAVPVALGVALLHTLFQTHSQFGEAPLRAALPLLGSSRVMEKIIEGRLEEALTYCENDARDFRLRRAPYLMYE